MTKLSWNDSGSRRYFAGVDRGVFYPSTGPGVSWNGLVSVNAREDASTESGYLDGVKQFQRTVPGSFEAAISAFTYPDEFSDYDGVEDGQIAQQDRLSFGLSYRTSIGDDLQGLDLGYQIHLVYNARVSPTESEYSSVDTETDLTMFEWPISTLPIEFPGVKPFSHVIIDSTIANEGALSELEDLIYGSVGVDPQLPSIQDIVNLFEENSILKITDNGDGTWTAEAPGTIIQMLDATTFEITWPSAIFIDSVSYRISSL